LFLDGIKGIEWDALGTMTFGSLKNILKNPVNPVNPVKELMLSPKHDKQSL